MVCCSHELVAMMVFGKTSEELYRLEQQKIIRRILGVKKFAWLPTRLWVGSYVWLSSYWEYCRGGREDNGNFFLWSGSVETKAERFYISSIKRYLHPNNAWVELQVKKDGKLVILSYDEAMQIIVYLA
jgi:hypothetical protein